MRIAKPLLISTTPIGVVWGVIEAYRFRPVLALLMLILISVVSAFTLQLVRTIRREQTQDLGQQKNTTQ